MLQSLQHTNRKQERKTLNFYDGIVKTPATVLDKNLPKTTNKKGGKSKTIIYVRNHQTNKEQVIVPRDKIFQSYIGHSFTLNGQFVGIKAKGRISKRVLQENKAH